MHPKYAIVSKRCADPTCQERRDRRQLIEICKLNAVDPQAYLADVLRRLVDRHPAGQIDQLMPWAYTNQVA
jgi:IS66 C-terminal element